MVRLRLAVPKVEHLDATAVGGVPGAHLLVEVLHPPCHHTLMYNDCRVQCYATFPYKDCRVQCSATLRYDNKAIWPLSQGLVQVLLGHNEVVK